MLRALLERSVRPDLVLGSSVGALNGLAVAADPSPAAVERLGRIWTRLQARDVFSSSLAGQLSNLVRYGTYLHSNGGLRRLIAETLDQVQPPPRLIEDLQVPFHCVAACIEDATASWFSQGPIVDAVLASCAVPGLLPPVRVGERHYVDGGLVASVPVGHAADLGADRIFVLHVGRLERPLEAPRRPWEVALVAFEISRRHQFSHDLARLPDGVEVHILPSGASPPSLNVRYRSSTAVGRRIEAAYDASSEYLDGLQGPG